MLISVVIVVPCRTEETIKLGGIEMSRSFPLAFATIVRGRDEAETALEQSTVTALAELGYPVCIASIRPGERNSDLLLDQTRVIALPFAPTTVGDQLRAALHLAASLAPHVFYLAGDKADFSATLMTILPGLLESITADDALINFGRTALAMDTFPANQRRTEAVINRVVATLTGAEIDAAYSAYIYCHGLAAAAEQTARFPGLQPLGWLIGQARRSGGRIRQVTGGYACPLAQRGENDDAAKAYRIAQCAQFLEGLTSSLA